jgi:hypothetical protein
MNSLQPETLVSLRHRWKPEYVSVRLTAKVLDERRMKSECTTDLVLITCDAQNYEYDRIKSLVGSGMLWARRCLDLDKGLTVETSRVVGIIDFEHERGLCLAVALAVSRQIGKTLELAAIGGEEWIEDPALSVM